MRYFINGRQVSESVAFAHLIAACITQGMGEDDAIALWVARYRSEEARDAIADMTDGTLEFTMQFELLPPECEQHTLFD